MLMGLAGAAIALAVVAVVLVSGAMAAINRALRWAFGECR